MPLANIFWGTCLGMLRGTREPKINVSSLHILRLSNYSCKLGEAVRTSNWQHSLKLKNLNLWFPPVFLITVHIKNYKLGFSLSRTLPFYQWQDSVSMCQEHRGHSPDKTVKRQLALSYSEFEVCNQRMVSLLAFTLSVFNKCLQAL